MTTWLILDSTQTVVNVCDDLNGKNPPKLDVGQSKTDRAKAPVDCWAGWSKDQLGNWQPPSPVNTDQIVTDLKALPADKLADVITKISVK